MILKENKGLFKVTAPFVLLDSYIVPPSANTNNVQRVLLLSPVLTKYQNVTHDRHISDLAIDPNVNQLVWQASLLLFQLVNNDRHPFRESDDPGQTRRNIIGKRFKMNINRQYIPIFNSLFVNCDEATFDISIEKLMTIVEADLENDKEGRPRVSLVQVKP